MKEVKMNCCVRENLSYCCRVRYGYLDGYGSDFWGLEKGL